MRPQILLTVSSKLLYTGPNSHWVEGPQDQGEASNGCIKGLGLAVFVGNGCTAVESELVDDDQVCKAGPNVPSPCLARILAKGSKQATEDHDDVGNQSHQDVGTTESSEESQIEEKKWSGDAPVNVSGPVDGADVFLMCVWNSFMGLGLSVRAEPNAVSSSHGEVGQEGKGGDEASQDMEQAFLL